jgi:hypothetical protein
MMPSKASPADSRNSLDSLGGRGLELDFFAIGLLVKLMYLKALKKIIGEIIDPKTQGHLGNVGNHRRAGFEHKPPEVFCCLMQKL